MLSPHQRSAAQHLNDVGRQQARIPEVILLGLALLGGSPAAFVAMYSFRQRHKTQSSGFLLGYWSIVAVQILALIFYFSL